MTHGLLVIKRKTKIKKAPKITKMPETPEAKESQEIVQRIQLSKLYKDLKVEDVYSTDLISELQSFKGKLPEKEQNILKHFDNSEKFLKALSQKNKLKVTKAQIQTYLKDISKIEKKNDFNKYVRASSIIKYKKLDSKSQEDFDHKILPFWEKNKKYRGHVKERLLTIMKMQKQKETILSTPVKYAKSANRWVAKNLEKIRGNWEAMSGRDKFVAGLALLFGTAYFLNTQNEGATKLRAAFSKMFMLGALAIGGNTLVKLATGRKATEITNAYINKKANVFGFYKDVFNKKHRFSHKMSKHETAETMNEAFVLLGNEGFIAMAEEFKRLEKNKSIPEWDKELGYGYRMSGHNAYRAMVVFNSKFKILGKTGLLAALKNAKKQAQVKGKSFVDPTFAQVFTAAVSMEAAKRFKVTDKKIDKKIYYGESFLSAAILNTTWKKHAKGTDTWFTLSGQKSHNWKVLAYTPKHKESKKVRLDHLRHLTKYKLVSSKALLAHITNDMFKRYTTGFRELYQNEYKKKPMQGIHRRVIKEDNALYLTSRVAVPSIKNEEAAMISATILAYKNVLNDPKLRKKHPKLAKKGLKKYLQPVQGIFLASPRKTVIGTTPDRPTHYVLFLRMTLPGSVEQLLRESGEWTEGSMIDMMDEENPMKKGEKLSRAEFETFTRQSLKGYKGISPFVGSYESFLARIGLTKDQTTKIDTVLRKLSLKFAGSGISKKGLAAYLAIHKFTIKEIRELLGPKHPIPQAVYGEDMVDQVIKATHPAVLSYKKEEDALKMMNDFGNLFILAVYKDKSALQMLEKLRKLIDKMPKGYVEISSKKIVIKAFDEMKRHLDAVHKFPPNLIGSEGVYFKYTVMPLYKKFIRAAASNKYVIKSIDKIAGEYRK